MHRTLVPVIGFVLLCSTTAAFADPSFLVSLGTLRAPHGWFLGADAGIAWLLDGSNISPHATGSTSADPSAWCFGARVGYQFASGVALETRVDNLGLDSPDSGDRLIVATAGVRYSLPVVPMPFVEALVGPMFHGSSASPSVGLAVGATLFVARHVSFDASLRDWIVDLDGVRNIPTLMLGMSAGYGG
jgi:hypothetical protein